jgi:hypothetical protein
VNELELSVKHLSRQNCHTCSSFSPIHGLQMGILNYQDSVLSRAFVARRKGRLQARDVRQIITRAILLVFQKEPLSQDERESVLGKP